MTVWIGYLLSLYIQSQQIRAKLDDNLFRVSKVIPSLFYLHKSVLSKIINRTDRHTQMSKDAVRGTQVEVKVGQSVVGNVLLAALKPEIARGLRLHDNRFLSLTGPGVLIRTPQDLDCPCDAVLQLLQGSLVVFKSDVVHDTESGWDEFGCVGTGLHLEW